MLCRRKFRLLWGKFVAYQVLFPRNWLLLCRSWWWRHLDFPHSAYLGAGSRYWPSLMPHFHCLSKCSFTFFGNVILTWGSCYLAGLFSNPAPTTLVNWPLLQSLLLLQLLSATSGTSNICMASYANFWTFLSNDFQFHSLLLNLWLQA